MLLFDASYINVGGGKVLLDQLINEIENTKVKVIYLIDKRYINNNLKNTNNKVLYIKSSFFIRFIIYFKLKNKINKIFIFSGIPPIYNFQINTFCFFQNVLLLDKNKNVFKYLYFKLFSFNIQTWFVQSNYIKNALYNIIHSKKIISAPFFLNQSYPVNNKKNNNDDEIKLLYVSSGEIHKNHIRLFECFNKLIKIYPKAILTVTISNNYNSLINIINYSKNIRNIGFIDTDLLNNEYHNSNIFIFPSLNESFGLGLIEANQHNLPILASDLPYVREIIETPYLFNPYSVDSMFDCIINCIESNYKLSSLTIKNKIDLIIEKIK